MSLLPHYSTWGYHDVALADLNDTSFTVSQIVILRPGTADGHPNNFEIRSDASGTWETLLQLTPGDMDRLGWSWPDVTPPLDVVAWSLT
jgi:hypothetical protein